MDLKSILRLIYRVKNFAVLQNPIYTAVNLQFIAHSVLASLPLKSFHYV